MEGQTIGLEVNITILFTSDNDQYSTIKLNSWEDVSGFLIFNEPT